MFKKTIKYITISLPILCLSFSANASDGYYQSEKLDYNFALMNNEFNVSSLMNAVLDGDYKATSVFISSGANVNQTNTAGCTALHFAARKGNAKIVKLLVDNGAKINIKDNDGWTPLMRASIANDMESVKILIESGAKIWYVNKWNESALLHSSMSNCFECAKIIINKTNLKDIKNREPLKKQNSEALEIINRKYNEEFRAFLKDFDEALNKKEVPKEISKIKIILKPEEIIETDIDTSIEIQESIQEPKKKCGFFKRILYVFTGKKISEKEASGIKKKEDLKETTEIKEGEIEDLKVKNKSNDIEEINLNENTNLKKSVETNSIEPREKPSIENKKEIIEENIEEINLNSTDKQPARKTVSNKKDVNKSQKISNEQNIKKTDLVNYHYKSIIPREKDEVQKSISTDIKEVSLNDKAYQSKYNQSKTTKKSSYKKSKQKSSTRDFDRIVPKEKSIPSNFESSAKNMTKSERDALIEKFLK